MLEGCDFSKNDGEEMIFGHPACHKKCQIYFGQNYTGICLPNDKVQENTWCGCHKKINKSAKNCIYVFVSKGNKKRKRLCKN